VDSLDMTDGQRREILSACLRCEESRVVIAHGTSTIIQTAQTLGPCIDGKTIVLFGAMIPYALGRSDALFNFGAALMAAQTLAPGVYVAMNGRAFSWDDVRKVAELGEFAPLA
jgi:L-asparaginase